MKLCSKCKTEKELTEFGKATREIDGHQYWCKLCAKNYQLENKIQLYHKRDKEKIAKCDHRYYIKNFLKIRQNQKEYYLKNKQKIIQKQNIYLRNRCKFDISLRITRNLRRRVNHALKRNSKSASTLSLLGCSIDTLKTYLSTKFTDGMSWENYGQWHVDHIIPCAKFDLSEEVSQRECFHYTNLQPLWAIDNLRKGDK